MRVAVAPSTMTTTTSRSLGLFLLFAIATLAGCSVESADPEADAPQLGTVSQAQDNDESDPNDGKVCYVDGPHTDAPHREMKGTMSGGSCCFRDDSGLTCYACTAYNECQVAGGQVGVRIAPGDYTTLGTVTTSTTKDPYAIITTPLTTIKP